MAHLAELQSVAGSLITSLTGMSDEDPHFQPLRTAATRGLRNQIYARTNQFEIRAKYEGLIEKFAVLNREDLADSLQSRWDELPERPAQWQPEILSLLLLLSDRPVEKTDLRALDRSHVLDDTTAALTWQEILEDDPVSDEELWKDIERGYHSSGDEGTLDDHIESEPTDTTLATSIKDDLETLVRLHVSQLDSDVYDKTKLYVDLLHNAQAADERTEVLELFMIRETISMLQGLPTTLYRYDEQRSKVAINNKFVLSTAAVSTITHQLGRCADLGSAIWLLRQWCRDGHHTTCAYVRTCKSCAQHDLESFDMNLAAIEHHILRPGENDIVSLTQVSAEVYTLGHPLKQLYKQVIAPAMANIGGSYILLDKLFDTACEAQMYEDNLLFNLCARLLVNTTATYLRPIGTWIRNGKVKDNDGSFFIEEADAGEWSLGSMWTKRFHLKTERANDQVSAPSFLQPLIDHIFALGKSQAFLEELHRNGGNDNAGEDMSQAEMTFVNWTNLEAKLANTPFLPFVELFTQSLRDWVAEKTGQTSDSLKSLMMRQRVLDFPLVLGSVFHSSDGIEFQSFATAFFRRLKRHTTGWQDSFLLTELAQETLGSCGGVSASSIAVSINTISDSNDNTAIHMLGCTLLNYSIAWPLQNITHEMSPTVDAQAFCLLLQAHYAKSILSQSILDFRHKPTFPGRFNASPSILKLRYRLLWFTDVLLAHIGSTTQRLRQRLVDNWKEARDIDSMAAHYQDYCRNLEMNLLLGRNLKPLKSALIDILKLADSAAQVLEASPSDEGTIDRIHSSFEKCRSFIVAGLKSLSRVDGENMLDSLAENLD